MKSLRKKTFHLLLVVWAVSALTFLMIDLLPGDAAYELAGPDASLEDIQALRKELGLDRHIVIRYTQWLGRALGGDLGTSVHTREPVLDAVLARLPVTIELMVMAQLFALLLAIPTGIVGAYRQGGWLDRALGSAAFATMSVPVFVLALLLILLFTLKLRWLPAMGYTPLSESLVMNVKSFILPAAGIAMVEWVPLMRVLRSDLIATLQQDYILMARAKGLPPRHILLHHALRPSALTLVTLVGLHIGHLMGGALIVETIFALPGIGRLLVGAIYGRDYNLIQGCVLLISVAYVVVNFFVDMVYPLLDPRIRSARPAG